MFVKYDYKIHPAVLLLYKPFSITKKNNIEIYLLLYCSPEHVYFLVLPQQSFPLGLYGPVLLHLLGTTEKYIALLGKTLLEI